MNVFLLSLVLIVAPVCSLRAQILQQIMTEKNHGGGAVTVNCGANQTDHTNSDNGNNGVAQGMTCGTSTNVSGYSVNSATVYLVAAASGNIQAAVYQSSTGLPLGSDLCHSGSQAVSANALNTITLTGCGTLAASTTYFVAFNNDTAGIAYGTSAAACTGSSGTNKHAALTFGTWGSGTWGTGNCNYQMYLTLTPLP